MAKKKVCMVVGNTFTHDSRVNKEAKSLVRAGYEVVVYAVNDGTFPREEKVGGVTVKRLRITSYSPVRLNVLRVPTEFSPGLFHLWREKADVYHAHDLDTLATCFLVSRINGAKLIYDTHELFLDLWLGAIDISKFEAMERKLIYPLLWLIERTGITRADSVITICTPIKEELERRYGVEGVNVLLNCPPKPRKAKRYRRFHEIFSLPSTVKTVLYQGGIKEARGLFQLVRAIEYLPENVYLVLVGKGKALEGLKKLASTLPSGSRVKFHEAVALEELPKYTASADVGVIPLLNTSLNNFYSMPNKLFQYMSVGLPIAATDFPNLRAVVNEVKCGALFNTEDPKDIARTISSILSNPKKMKKMSENALKASKEKYNWKVEEKKLREIYDKL